MKAIVLIIGLVLGLNSYAQTQEEQLKAHDWYVYKVVIDEQEYFPLNNEENQNTVNLFFYQDDFVLGFCGELCGTNAEEFSVLISESEIQLENGFVCFGTGCGIYENYDFYDKYWVFWSYIYEGSNRYEYEINDIDGIIKELVVTRLSNGNKAYYHSAYLSSEQHVFEEAKIYPNPAQTVINVELPASEYQNVIFDLYDISGKKLKTFTKSWSENIQLNISDLPAGSYLLEMNVLENTHKGYMVKLIKE